MKANYFKVGLFVLVALAILVAAVVVLGAGYIGRTVVYFETYFDESVSGLAVGSIVEVRGVRLGEVREISFLREVYDIPAGDPNARGVVRVVFAVYPAREGNRPPAEFTSQWLRAVGRGLRVRLSSNIITGQAILEGTYVDPNRFPPLRPTWEPRHPYIPAIQSELTTIKDSVDRVLTKLEQLDVNNLVTTTRNLMLSLTKAVGQADVPALSEQARALFGELRDTNKRLLILVTGSPELSGQNIPEVIKRVNEAMDRVNAALAAGRPQMDTILTNLSEVSVNLKDLTETLRANPSELIRSTPPPKTEPFK
jgi:paraquat-inducible protein B